VPPTVSAFLTQQHRWNKGLIQTALKLMPAIAASRAPLKTKIEAWFHLTSPLVHLAIVLLALLALPILLLPGQFETPSLHTGWAMVIGATLLVLGTLAACTFYMTSQWALGLGLRRTLLRLPALMSLGIGISLTNTRAVIEAVLGKPTPFLRTPKYAGGRESEDDPLLRRSRRSLPPGMLELALGLLMTACFVTAFVRPHTVIGAPFLLLFAAGYLGIGVPAFRRAWESEALGQAPNTRAS
jgi:hypothetical protein